MPSATPLAAAARPEWCSLGGAGRLGAGPCSRLDLAAVSRRRRHSLLLLVATFEAVRTLHLGVERIGRYLQVFHEPEPPAPGDARWEHVAMALGPGSPERPVTLWESRSS